MPTDTELLRRYADEKSESAFGELVQRQVNLVYSIALRQCGGDAQLAEDVTQRVFTDLARKARQLSGYAVLGGWLYRSAQFAASDVVRAERRRRVREKEAQAMQEISRADAGDTNWQKLAPVLDQAIGELAARDRDAVVLRFFESRAFSEIGATLRLSEDAARMRVERALEKLRTALIRRGITSTTAALGTALASQAAAAAPAGVAASVTGAALAGAGVAAGVAAGGDLIATLMSMTKLQVGISGALAVASITGLALQARTNAALRDEVASLRQDSAAIATVQTENTSLARTAAEVADLRNDDAEFKRLSDESAVLQKRLQLAATPAPSGEVYDPAKLDQLPRAESRTRPQYPADMRKAGISGEVTVDFIVDRGGNVVNAFAARSSQREFEAAAVEAVSQWKFRPGTKGGRDVNTHMEVPIVFSMDRKEGTPGEATPKGGTK